MSNRTKSNARTKDPLQLPVSVPRGRSRRLRQRAAWMYFVEEMTQSAIADALGIGRITVVRLLAEARELREVRISLSREFTELSRLEIGLQKKYSIPEVIVAPVSSAEADPRPVIAAVAENTFRNCCAPT